MLKKRKPKKWPEHTSWWDRNEFKINVLLWVVFFGLLLIARVIFVNGWITSEIVIIWLSLFVIDLMFLSFTSNGVHK